MANLRINDNSHLHFINIFLTYIAAWHVIFFNLFSLTDADTFV